MRLLKEAFKVMRFLIIVYYLFLIIKNLLILNSPQQCHNSTEIEWFIYGPIAIIGITLFAFLVIFLATFIVAAGGYLWNLMLRKTPRFNNWLTSIRTKTQNKPKRKHLWLNKLKDIVLFGFLLLFIAFIIYGLYQTGVDIYKFYYCIE